MQADKYQIISAGLSEAAKMKAAVAQAGADSRVTMPAGHFSVLAALVESLCEVAQGADSGGMGDARYWVPLEEYAKLKREAQRLATEQASLGVSLSRLN